VLVLNLKVGFVQVKVTVGGMGVRGHINPVSKGGVQKFPCKIFKKKLGKNSVVPQKL
jgi:hypothetical protein